MADDSVVAQAAAVVPDIATVLNEVRSLRADLTEEVSHPSASATRKLAADVLGIATIVSAVEITLPSSSPIVRAIGVAAAVASSYASRVLAA